MTTEERQERAGLILRCDAGTATQEEVARCEELDRLADDEFYDAYDAKATGEIMDQIPRREGVECK